jgi:hypothetical protein
MLCFEVLLNGKRLALAAVDGGVLTAIVSSVYKDGATIPDSAVSIGGLSHGTHLDWGEKAVGIGDRIEIVLVEAERSDPPIRERHESETFNAQAERRYYERLKQKYDP